MGNNLKGAFDVNLVGQLRSNIGLSARRKMMVSRTGAIWPAPPSWDYEGVLTVGEGGGFGVEVFGYIYQDFGSTHPDLLAALSIEMFAWQSSGGGTMSVVGKGVEASNLTIYIDGSVYTGFTGTIDKFSKSMSNPFPAVGQSCDIKISFDGIYE